MSELGIDFFKIQEFLVRKGFDRLSLYEQGIKKCDLFLLPMAACAFRRSLLLHLAANALLIKYYKHFE
jgi:hypothetical protein